MQFLDPDFSNLSSEQLTEIDRVCSHFETQRMDGKSLSIEDLCAASSQAIRVTLRQELARTETEILDSWDQLPPRFRIVRHLADGGIGSVYVAFDQDLNREVAIKELQRKFANNALVLERFQSEATITGGLEHPNIVPIYATGTRSDGRPYYAMRLIGGRSMQVAIADLHRMRLNHSHAPIDFRNDAVGRDLLQRLIVVCRAIGFAHSRGVLHRDLKPSNIMVGAFGETLVVDWGLARKLQSDSPDQVSQPGTVVGTPGYMSPEQATGRSSELSAASDIYSLGALLYTLITDRIPTQHTGGRSAIERASDTVDVDMQSSAVGDVKKSQGSSHRKDVGKTDVCIQNNRTTHYELSPRKYHPMVPRELDAICLKATRFSASQRYLDAEQLASDLEAWLGDQPILALHETRWHRCRRFAKCHPTAMGAGVGSILIAMSGMAITLAILSSKNEVLRQANQREVESSTAAARNALQADRQRQVAEAVQNFLQHDLLRQASAKEQAVAIRGLGIHFEIKENPTIKELLERAALELSPTRIELKFPNQSIVQASILQTVGDTYLSIGEYASAIEFLDRANSLYAEVYGSDHTFTLSTMLSLACAYRERGQFSKTIQLIERVLERQNYNFAPDSPELLDSQYNLAVALRMVSRLTESIDLFEKVHAAQAKRLGLEHPNTLSTLNDLIWATYTRDGDNIKAIDAFEKLIATETKMLGVDHPITLSTMSNHAVVTIDTHDMERSMKLLTLVCDAYVKVFGAEHPETLSVRHNVAVGYKMDGEFAKAIAMFRELYEIEVLKLGIDHSFTLSTLSYLARTLWDSGERDESLVLSRQIAFIVEKRKFQDEFDGRRMNGIILRLQEAGLYEEAEDWWRKWLDTLREEPDSDRHLIAVNQMGLGENLIQQKKWLEAEKVLRNCLTLTGELATNPTINYQPIPHMTSGAISNAKTLLGQVLTEKGKFTEAEETLVNAYKEFGTTKTAIQIIHLYQAWGKPDLAAEWNKRANQATNSDPSSSR